MSGWAAALLALVAVTNPVGISRAVAWSERSDPHDRRRLLAVTGGATAVLVVLVLVTGPVLDSLSLSTPTFRLGVSVVMGLSGARWMLAPIGPVDGPLGSRDEMLTLGATMLLAPGPVLVAMAGGADGGLVAGLVSVVVTMAVTAALLAAPPLRDPGASAVARLIGAVAVVVAVAIGIDSARSV